VRRGVTVVDRDSRFVTRTDCDSTRTKRYRARRRQSRFADRVMYTVKHTTKDGVSFATLDHRGLQVEASEIPEPDEPGPNVAASGPTG
jgi:hypothetical protein